MVSLFDANQCQVVKTVLDVGNATVAVNGKYLAAVRHDGLRRCLVDDASSCVLLEYTFGDVNEVVMTVDGDVYVGSSQGLYYIAQGSTSPVKDLFFSDVNVISIAIDPKEVDKRKVAVGTLDNVYRLVFKNGEFVWYGFRVPGLIDASPKAMAFDRRGNLWIGNDVGINIQMKDLLFVKVDGLSGMPYGNITNLVYVVVFV